MGLSATQRFLVEASRAVGSGEYFRWKSVGVALGYTDAESDKAVRSLDEQRLLIRLLDGDARLLAAGRQAALRLKAKVK